MEKQNMVPDSMSKRKFIAGLLNIPPILLGIPTLETVTFAPHPKTIGAQTISKLVKVRVDTTKYESDLRALWVLHSTSQVQAALTQINANILDLESLEVQAGGSLLYRVQELLFSYQILAAQITRDQSFFGLSYFHANQAVRVALATKDTDLIATGRYTRGCTYLEWGMFGSSKMRIFQVQRDKIESAIRDFELARNTPEGGELDLHSQLLGHIRTHLGRARTVLAVSRGAKDIPASVVTILNNTAENVEQHNINDPYTRVLVTGYWHGFTLEGYHSARAVVFNIGKAPGTALKEINTMESLQQGTLGKDLTRTQTWLDIVRANTFMGLGEFEEATKRAKRALISAKDIHSTTNVARVADIYGRLLLTPYKDSSDVKELGDIIYEHEMNHQESEETQMIGEQDY